MSSPVLVGNASLVKAVSAKKMRFTINSTHFTYRFAEVSTLFITRPTDATMIEFKVLPYDQEQINSTAEKLVSLIENELSIKLKLRQFIGNKSDRVQYYVNLQSRPKSVRNAFRQLTTRTSKPSSMKEISVTAKSTSLSLAMTEKSKSPASSRRVTPPIRPKGSVDLGMPSLPSTSARPREHQTGELLNTLFNEQQVTTFVLRTSSSTQTDVRPLTEMSNDRKEPIEEETHVTTCDNTTVPPPQDYSALLRNRLLSRNHILTKVRNLLSYFMYNKDIVHNHQSYLSLVIELNNEGLSFDTTEELRQLYIQFVKNRGFTDEEIEKDLVNLRHHHETLRTKHLHSAGHAHSSYGLPFQTPSPRPFPYDVATRTKKECQLM